MVRTSLNTPVGPAKKTKAKSASNTPRRRSIRNMQAGTARNSPTTKRARTAGVSPSSPIEIAHPPQPRVTTHATSSPPQPTRRNAPSTSTPTDHDPRFRSIAHENYFKANILRRKIVPDRAFEIAEGNYPEYSEEIQKRGWDNFCSLADNGWREITQEFYANAMRFKGDQIPKFHTMVKGMRVDFTAANINRVLEIYTERQPGQMDFTDFKNSPDKDYIEILHRIGKPGTTWQLNLAQKPKCITTKNLLPFAKVWSTFLLNSFMPVKHSSTLAVKRAELLFAIVNDMYIDVGEVISECILNILKTKRDSLAFPSLITLLCEDAGVEVGEYQEKIRSAPPISVSMVKEIYATTSCTSAAPIPTQFRKEKPMKMKDILHLLVEKQNQLAERQTELHSSLKAGTMLVECVLMNIGQKLGMTKDELYHTPDLAENAQCLRSSVFKDLPIYKTQFPQPTEEVVEEEEEEEEEEDEEEDENEISDEEDDQED